VTRALAVLHLLAGLGAGAAYLVDAPARGLAVLAVGAGYVAGLGVVALRSGDRDLRRAWQVLAPLSVLQVLPDWVLVAVAGTLRFPDLGAPRLGDAVPLYMSFLWVPPLLAVVLVARGRAWLGALAAVVVFAVAELSAPSLGLWEPVGHVRMLSTTALYVLPAEAVLGAAVVVAVERVRGWAQALVGAAAVALLYTGALLVSLLLLDRAALTLG
jgi:hypothetical protein